MTPHVAVCVGLLALAPSIVSAQSGALRIVVVAGEDAVNIVQQKTAVAPVVEVRDRNNLPVAGVAVTFSVGGQGATFGGLSTLTVTTNAAGQAAAAGLTPTAAGAIQINATALVQGQALTATITQTNVLTAAQAAGISGASGASGAAGGGGGLSATTIGIVGAAVGGGALVATQVAGGDGGTRELAANFTMEMTLVFGPCTRLERYSGLVAIEFESFDSDPLSGRATIQNGRVDVISGTPGCTTGPQPGQSGQWGFPPTTASGPASNITFTMSETIPGAGGNSGPATNTLNFQGAKNGDSIAGTLSYATRIDNGQFGITSGTTSATVTLTPH